MVWTHPSHKGPAFAAFIYDIGALILVCLALTSNLYCDYRPAPYKCSALIDRKVECDTFCQLSKSGSSGEAAWQIEVFLLVITALSANALTVALQTLVFWPLVATGRVYGIILTVCSFFHGLSGTLKFTSAFMLIDKMVDVNPLYVNHVPGSMEINILPSGYLLFSMILQFISIAMLRVATDVGSPGQPTYLEIIEDEEMERLKMERMSKKCSIYDPKASLVMLTVDAYTEGLRSSTSIW